MNTLIIPTLFSGFFFTFASRCIPTFFTFFLSSQGYNNKDIILISSIYFIGSLITASIIFNVKKSIKIFHISATIGTIILLLQYRVSKVYGWFFIRFLQGILESFCRSALHNIIIDKYRHVLVFIMNLGITSGFLLLVYYQKDSSLLFTITGILLSMSHLCLAFQSYFHCNNTSTKVKSAELKHLWTNNKHLFLIVVLSYLLNGTFNTILPIMLKGYFTQKQVALIMFTGSLGSTILQLITYYIRNLFGEITSMKNITNIIMVAYVACFFSIQYFKIMTSFFIFIIMGIHFSLNSMSTTLLRDTFKEKTDLYLDSAFHKLNNLGSILAAFLSLFFIDNFSRYGLFLNWFLVIILIKILLNLFLKNKSVEE